MLGSIFKRTPDAAEVRGQSTPWGDWDAGSLKSWSGETVTAGSAMQLLTVYGCVRLITDSIATLPVDTFRLAGDLKTEIPKPSWLESPTVDLDFTSWCTQVLSSLLLHGNAYVIVVRFPDGRGISELIPLDPCQVTVYREGGRKAYRIGLAKFPGEIVHIKGLMLPGSDVGCSPVEYARQSIGLGLATAKYGSEYFESEGNMPGVIEMPGRAQPETMRMVAESWRRRRSKGGRGLPGMLQEGATWKPTGVTNEQAQFLATRQFTAAEIAGQMFMVDPTELGIGVMGQSLTYANLEQRNTRFIRVALTPWIVRLERMLTTLLMDSSAFVRFNVDGFLRSDALTRAQSYEVLSGIGVLTIDEIRDLEDRGPLSDEDKKQSRAWQEVGLPALVSGGLMTPNEARAQLGLPPVTGGDVVLAPVDMAPVEEPRALHVHVENQPPAINIDARQDAPVSNINVPINVEQPATQIDVHVPEQPATQIDVHVPEQVSRSKRIEHDAEGRITRVVEE